jgi:chromosome segregation ATPase
MTTTTEEAERLAEMVEDQCNLSSPAIALRSLAAERDALRAENARLRVEVERLGTACDNYYRQVSLMQMRHARHLPELERRIARQRRALAKLYGKRHDKNGRLSNFLAGLTAENASLREALRLAIGTVEFWAAYATPYFQDKHDLEEDLQKLRAALGETQ